LSESTDPPRRRDAQRNRDVLLVVARRAFTTTDDSVPLESIAREAGVGIGTLYRHFPTREALVEAVYAAELDDVVAAAADLLASEAPDVALHSWMTRYGVFVIAKRGMLDTLRSGWASGRMATPTTRERITATLSTITRAGVQAGTLRADVDPDDVTTLLLGVFLSMRDGATPERTDRLLSLLIDGLRVRCGGAGCVSSSMIVGHLSTGGRARRS